MTAENLKGLWAAVPTPWTQHGQLDAGMLRRNCERLAGAGVAGIYTTDSDGEFYAIELPEFEEFARTFGRVMADLGVPAQMGVTWSHTEGIVARVKAAARAGITTVHVAFPYFVPLAPADVDRFWDDLASAAPETRWVHYAHPRCGPRLSGRDYARLAERHPRQLLGTKLSTDSVTELAEILFRSPGLAHFVTDRTVSAGVSMGACGCYSYWVNTLPRWHLAYWQACVGGRWPEAARMHRKLEMWELGPVERLREAGFRHATMSKARIGLTGWLEDGAATRAPYQPVPRAMQQEFRREFDTYWADEVSLESFPPAQAATREAAHANAAGPAR